MSSLRLDLGAQRRICIGQIGTLEPVSGIPGWWGERTREPLFPNEERLAGTLAPPYALMKNGSPESRPTFSKAEGSGLKAEVVVED